MLLLARRGWKVSLVAGIFGVGLLTGALQGQSTWTGTDIGTTGAAGSYTFSSGTGTLTGAGTGVSGTADNFSYAYTPVSGNVEIIAQVWSQSNTSNYATAGLMIRQSTAPDAPEAYLSVSPMNGVNFTWRVGTGGTAITTLGPSVSAPVWLRIVKSGNSIAGYESPDGTAWKRVGSGTMAVTVTTATSSVTTPTISGTFTMGLAVSSLVSGTLSAATFSPIVPMISVPQRTANMQLWLRGDVGVTLSGSNKVSQWTDQSTYGYNAVQSGTTNQPTVVLGAVSGLPDIAFSGTSQFMQFPSGFSDFTAGADVFLVTKPTAATSSACFIELGVVTANDLKLSRSGTTANLLFYAYNGGSSSSITGTNALTSNVYQILEAVHSGSGSATLSTNGSLVGSGTLFNYNNVLRTSNYLGAQSGSSFYFQGEMAEVLVYNSPLSAADRATVQAYLAFKYGLATAIPQASAPVYSPPESIYATSQNVSIISPNGGNIFYTLDGSAPDPTKTPYTGPIAITTSTTIRAMAVVANYTNSPGSTATYTINADSGRATRNGLALWLSADTGVNLSGSNTVTQWDDLSANGKNATQTVAASQPLFVSSATTGLPAVSLSGTNQYLRLPGGFADFTAGVDIFLVTMPTAASNNAEFIELGNSGTDSFRILRSGTTANLFFDAYNVTTLSRLTGTNAVALNQYQVIEGQQTGASTGFIYNNVTLTGTGALTNLNTVNRLSNFIGSGNGSGYFKGEIAEVMVYNRALSTGERAGVSSYLAAKYGLTAAIPPAAAPTYSLPETVYATPQTLAITSPNGGDIYYTTDGSPPSPSSTHYTGPITINTTTQIRAMAVVPFYTNSPASTLNVTIDPNSADVPRDGLSLWLAADSSVTASGSSTVMQWNDLSGNGNNAGQVVPANQPLLQPGLLNGHAVIKFDGSNDSLSIPDAATMNPNQLTIFVVGKYSSGSGGTVTAPFLVKSGSTNWANGYGVMKSNSDAYMFTNNSGTTGLRAAMAPDIWNLMVARYDLQQERLAVVGSTLSTLNISATSINNVTNPAYIGGQISSLLDGSVAEIMMYRRALSDQERQLVEYYLQQKYLVGYPAVTTPTFSDSSGTTFAQPSQVALSIPALQSGATIYYTRDGSAPTTSSTVYTGPIWVAFTSTIKAFAAVPGYNSSGTVTGTFTLNSGTWPAPTSGTTAPAIFLQLPNNTVPHP